MRTIAAVQGQTIWDIALQAMGTADAVFTILTLNQTLRPDQELDADTEVIVPDEPTKPLVVSYYEANDIQPLGNIASATL